MLVHPILNYPWSSMYHLSFRLIENCTFCVHIPSTQTPPPHPPTPCYSPHDIWKVLILRALNWWSQCWNDLVVASCMNFRQQWGGAEISYLFVFIIVLNYNFSVMSYNLVAHCKVSRIRINVTCYISWAWQRPKMFPHHQMLLLYSNIQVYWYAKRQPKFTVISRG